MITFSATTKTNKIKKKTRAEILHSIIYSIYKAGDVLHKSSNNDKKTKNTWITGSWVGSGNRPLRPAHSMSKLNIRNGAIFENSPSGTWLTKFEKLRVCQGNIILPENIPIMQNIVCLYKIKINVFICIRIQAIEL